MAQASQTVSGYVEDASNGERLIGATLYDAGARLGTTTNNFGFFSYTYAADTLRLTAAYVGKVPESGWTAAGRHRHRPK